MGAPVNRILSLIQQYPLVAGFLLAMVFVACLLSVFAVAMHRAGMSLKPLLWFAGFFAIVLVPQFTVHVLDAVMKARVSQTLPIAQTLPPGAAEPGPVEPPSSSPSPRPWAKIFGPEADPAMSVDPRKAMGMVFGAATDARLAVAVSREDSSAMVFAARFEEREQALAAFESFGALFQVQGANRWASDGHTGARATLQDWVHMVVAGSEFYCWTGATRDDVIGRRTQALGPPPAADAVAAQREDRSADALAAAASHDPYATWPAVRWLIERPSLLAGFVTINLAAAVLWFFWGLGWATRVSPPPDAGVAWSAFQLRQALQSLRAPEQRLSVAADGAIQVDWETSARWLDGMGAQGLRRTHRLQLRLDESRRRVRVTDYVSAVNASAGLGGLRLDWHNATGISFFEVRQDTVFGVQLDAHGRPTGALSRTIRFDLQALKRPAQELVLRAGWSWQPVLIDLPAPLHWLSA